MFQSEWIGHSEPRVTTNHLARRGEELLVRIKRRGVNIPPDNRLSRAIRFIDKWNEDYRAGNDVRPDDFQTQRLFLESHKVLMDALFVVFARDERVAGEAAIRDEHLRSFLEGSDSPVTGKADSPRDFQFEGYVGASLVMSGLKVTRSEPDFTVQFDGDTIGVAAKRLTSTKPKKLFDRLRDAHTQIRQSAGSGFVAVNLDSWGDSQLSGDSPAQFGLRFAQDLQEAYKQLGRLSERPALLGAIIFRSSSAFDFSGDRPRFGVQSGTQIVAFTENDKEQRRVFEFFGPALAQLRAGHAEIGQLLVVQSNAAQ
jgi:hypothetical protein